MGAVIYRLTGIEQSKACLVAARTAEANGEIGEAVAMLEMARIFMQQIKVADAPAIRVRGRRQLRQLRGTG